MNEERKSRRAQEIDYFNNPPHISEEAFKYLDKIFNPGFIPTYDSIANNVRYEGKSEAYFAGMIEGFMIARQMLEQINSMFWEDEED